MGKGCGNGALLCTAYANMFLWYRDAVLWEGPLRARASLGALDDVRLRRLNHARPAHGILQVVQRSCVRRVRTTAPLVAVDVLVQIAVLLHVT